MMTTDLFAGRRVGVAGLGVIGKRVAQFVSAGAAGPLKLTAVASRDKATAREFCSLLVPQPAVVTIEDLATVADLVVDCTPADVFRRVAEPVIEAGATLLPLSVAALLDNMGLVDRAAETGAQIIVPTGAILGLDTVRAMGVGTLHRVALQTRKPPRGLLGAPHLIDNKISLEGISEPLLVFSGNAREAARGFPANVNVAAALALAGVGPDRTEVEVWADPTIDRNVQSVTIESDAGEATMTIWNVPSEENPKTGKVVAQSVVAALTRHVAPLVVGS
ncbi:MAG: aspartate dehydrogenase [Hyphomicrobiaceae bacterium]